MSLKLENVESDFTCSEYENENDDDAKLLKENQKRQYEIEKKGSNVQFLLKLL